MLLAISAGWFLSLGMQMTYPMLLPHIREAYGLDLTTAGLLLSVLFLAYGTGQLPGGLLADRVGEGNIMVVSTLLAAATLALVVIANSVPMLFVATALFGLGTALFAVARFTALADLFPDQLGAATGVTLAAGDVGNSLLPPLAGFVAIALIWQFSFGIAIPLFLLVSVALWATVPARTSGSTSAVDTLSLENASYVLGGLRQRSIVYGTTIMVLYSSIWQTFAGFYPTYLIEIKGIDPTRAGILFGLYFALGVVLKPIAGGAYDRFSTRRTLMALISIGGVTLAILPFVEGFWPLALTTVFVSALLGIGTIMLSYLTAALPDDMRGTGLGSIRTTYRTASSVSPVLFGIAADRGFFNEAFFALAVLACLILLLITRIPEESVVLS